MLQKGSGIALKLTMPEFEKRVFNNFVYKNSGKFESVELKVHFKVISPLFNKR